MFVDDSSEGVREISKWVQEVSERNVKVQTIAGFKNENKKKVRLVTRKDGNHLPVTSFKIDVDYPCLDSGSQITAINHPLALQKEDKCKEAEENKKGELLYDKRYKSVDVFDNTLGKVTENELF